MKDKFGEQIYVGDIVQVSRKPCPIEYGIIYYSYIGKVCMVKTIRTGYGFNEYIIVETRERELMIARESKYIYKLPKEEAVLWMLENL
jgi:hypothetical protein